MKAGELVVVWVLATALACAWAAERAFPQTITGDEEERFEAAMETLGPELLQWFALGLIVLGVQYFAGWALLLVLLVEAVRQARKIWARRGTPAVDVDGGT